MLVDDGQIIVLGGLMEDTTSDNAEKVTGLGDIPVIGNLFKYQKRDRVKRNLMVFLRPTILRSNEQSVSLAADRYDYMRNIEINAQPGPKAGLPDISAPVLPPMEDGRPQGGVLINPLPQAGTTQTPASQPPAVESK